VQKIGNNAFNYCQDCRSLIFDNFSANPQWAGNDIFGNWDNYGYRTVSVTGSYTSVWTSQDALNYAKSKGLPQNWEA
jgi:hypothetical protein